MARASRRQAAREAATHLVSRFRKGRRGRRVQPGASPGTFVADPSAMPTRVRVCIYDKERVTEPAFTSVAELRARVTEGAVAWVRVTGLGDAALMQHLAEGFGMHPLALEDVGNTHQRAKVEDYDDHLFVVVRAPAPGETCGVTEQIALVLGDGWLLSFEERESPLFEPVLARIRQGRGRIRQRGADYVAYAVIDTVVDSYFPVLESVNQDFDALEDTALSGRVVGAPARIYALQRQLSTLRQHAWPHREAVGHLLRDETGFVRDENKVFFRDCADHATHVVEATDALRDRGQNLMGLLVSLSGARMNEIMKVLTIIATIFIPLTFLAGVYGMNFDTEASPWNMPELGWRYGYPASLLLMLLIGIGMVIYFRRIGWIGPRSKEEDPLR